MFRPAKQILMRDCSGIVGGRSHALMKGLCNAGMAWGNGFTVNQTLIQQYNLSDPSGFFEDISAVPALVSRTLLSVHIYGPNITVRP